MRVYKTSDHESSLIPKIEDNPADLHMDWRNIFKVELDEEHIFEIGASGGHAYIRDKVQF